MSVDERVYQGYVEYCRRIAVEPMSFEAWYLHVEQLDPVDAQSRFAFHGYSRDGEWRQKPLVIEMHDLSFPSMDEVAKTYEDAAGYVFP